MSRALEDVVVLDLTKQFCASLAAAFLGDFGARVIRLDLLPISSPSISQWNCEADLAHRNKESLALDMTSERGRALLHELVAKSDVIITDWSRGELEALSLDYTGATVLRPDIVFARLSGFGPVGPDRDLPAIDELAAARTGMMPILQQPGQPPIYTGAGAMHATVMLAFGVVTALMHRLGSGEGQEVDVSLFGANMYGAALDIQAFLAIGQGERFLNPISRLDVSNPMSGALYPSEDGRWITVTMPDTDRWWPVFSTMVGLAADDPRFDTHEKRTEIHRLELCQELELLFSKKPGSYWRQAFMDNQMSADVIEQFDYPANDPQVLANRYILKLEHPSFGSVKSLGFPIFMSDSPARLNRLAPCAGQHTPQLLAELLEYSEETIYQLRMAGVVA